MDYEYQSPGFTAEGVEPPASLKSDGFKTGYKPPADYFSWFWTRVSRCITELQTKLSGAAKNDLSNVEDDTFRSKASNAGVGGIQTVRATSSDGVAYAATVTGVTELTNGMMLTIIPEITSTSTAITLNVNGLGAKMVRLALSFNTAAATIPKLPTYYSAGRPVTLMYDENYIAGGIWKTVDKQKTSSQDLYGTVPIDSGGTGAETAAEARKNLGIVDAIYPVGSIYMSVNATSPATLFGGTWEQIKDAFLLSAGDTYVAGTTGGEAEHTLTIDEMPRHRHTYSGRVAGGSISGWGIERQNMNYEWIEGTGDAGGSQPHNNMPPYLAVYVWKRTA